MTDELADDSAITITAMVCGTVILLAGYGPFGAWLITIALGFRFGRAVQ